MKPPRYVVVERACCGTCVHYRQHYTLLEKGSFRPLWYGHCAVPRRKRRMPDEVCQHWRSGERPEDGA